MVWFLGYYTQTRDRVMRKVRATTDWWGHSAGARGREVGFGPSAGKGKWAEGEGIGPRTSFLFFLYSFVFSLIIFLFIIIIFIFILSQIMHSKNKVPA
jgi:hypothetical protein